jgi:hypothetical protein
VSATISCRSASMSRPCKSRSIRTGGGCVAEPGMVYVNARPWVSMSVAYGRSKDAMECAMLCLLLN